MKWGDVQLQTSADGTEFFEYTQRQTKTRTGAEPKDNRTVKPKCFLSQGVTEIHLEPSTFMLLKDRKKLIQRTAHFI